MKTFHISIGGERGVVNRLYNCGSEGELYDKALEVDEDDGEAVYDFMDEEFDRIESVEHVIIPTSDGSTNVTVEDENGNTVFDGEVEMVQNLELADGVTLDSFEYDENVRKECLKIWEDTNDDDEEVNVLSVCDDLDHVFKEEFEDEDNVFVMEYIETYGMCYDGDIELEDDEEFDIDKLTIFTCDNDDNVLSEIEGCRDCVEPTIKYGNKFYRLYNEDWEMHYCLYKIGTLSELAED